MPAMQEDAGGTKIMLKTFTEAELKELTEKHWKWLRGEAGGSRAVLSGADLSGAVLSADLSDAVLNGADLSRAVLSGTKYLIKPMGVEPGNCYWKRFNEGLKNNNFKFYVGLNKLRDGEVFASDDRVMCSYPGFHFSSRSWCAVNCNDRPLEAHIRIPVAAQINEPWATDGKARADMIEILQVFEVATGKDVTEQYKRPEVPR